MQFESRVTIGVLKIVAQWFISWWWRSSLATRESAFQSDRRHVAWKGNRVIRDESLTSGSRYDLIWHPAYLRLETGLVYFCFFLERLAHLKFAQLVLIAVFNFSVGLQSLLLQVVLLLLQVDKQLFVAHTLLLDIRSLVDDWLHQMRVQLCKTSPIGTNATSLIRHHTFAQVWFEAALRQLAFLTLRSRFHF